MILKNVTPLPVTGTGTITIDNGYFGAYKLNTDGVNAGSVIIKNTNVNGDSLVDSTTLTGEFLVIPQKCDNTIFYSVTGVGADLVVYQAIRQTI